MAPMASTSHNRANRRALVKQSRLRVEVLEDRRVLSAITWSTGVALTSGLSNDAAILADDHSLLLFGGSTVNDLAYSPSTLAYIGPWSSTATFPAMLSNPGVGAIGGGKLLVYGGSGSDGVSKSAWVYDPANPNNIVSTGSMNSSRTGLAFATDGSNRPYAIGGTNYSGENPIFLSTVERYDPTSGVWSYVASLPGSAGLSGAAAVYDGVGHILVFGGATSSAPATNRVLEYTIATDVWSTLAAMPTATANATAVLGADGTIYVLGGRSTNGSALNSVQVYNTAANSWSAGTPLPSAVSDEAAVSDALGRIEVIGGRSGNGSALATVSVTQSLANVLPAFTTTTLPPATGGVRTRPRWLLPASRRRPTRSFGAGRPSHRPDDRCHHLGAGAAEIGNQTVTVQAQNAAGDVQQTFTLAVMPDTTPPTVPVLSVGAITTTSAIPLSWTASTDNVGVAGYRLFAYTPAYATGHSGRDGGITYHPATYSLLVDGISPTTTSYTFTGLSPDTTYNYAVAAYDAAGNQSGYSTAGGTTLQVPSINYYVNSSINPPLSVVANHQLYFTLGTSGNPAPALSLVSAPSGVAFTSTGIAWTPTAAQAGLANDIVFQAVNSVGSYTLDIPVTVTADLPVPSLTVNGGLAYTLGNFSTVKPNAYQVALNPGFDITYGTHPQYAFAGTPFTFQLTGVSNTNPTTYARVSGPSTMTLDANTGIGTWTPSAFGRQRCHQRYRQRHQ